MKFVVSLSMLALSVSALGAQQTPPRLPRTPVAPAPRPVPTPRVRAIDVLPVMPLDIDLDFDQSFTVNPDLDLALQDRLGNLQLRSQELADRARMQADRALQSVDVQQLRNMAQDRAFQAMQNVDLGRLQDLALMASGDEHFSRPPRTPWAQGDPADSLYRLAREAFNRGDWRHAADSFAQIVQKFPRSAYVADCAYYEAFSRYRIGTTDELHKALTLLGNQNGPATRSSRKADVAGLAARVRGALAARGDRQAAAQIAQEAEKSGGCDREDMSVKAEALNALGQMDPNAATPLLQRVLARKDTCSAQLKRSALFMLVRRGDTVATNALIGVATNDNEDTNLRSDAISYLGRLPGEQALTTLESLVKTSNDDRIQRAAVRALSQNDTPRARQSVRALIERNDVSESLRSAAIETLASDHASAEDAAYLRSLFPKLPSERLQRSVLLALARLGGTDNQQFLMAVASNRDLSADVRGAAISYAGRVGTIPVADLVKLYDASDSRNMREQIIGVLGQRDDAEAADKLMDIIKNGTDPNTRRVAIGVLSRNKNDPRVTKFLLDLVGR
ncbi:MAG TPA: HEAT repeat domain-containing protein [Gemmatimonadaceae bacterium]|nr:HEAT repeat domain-containing protein [Gemmatimonadaceae bacterium]